MSDLPEDPRHIDRVLASRATEPERPPRMMHPGLFASLAQKMLDADVEDMQGRRFPDSVIESWRASKPYDSGPAPTGVDAAARRPRTPGSAK